MTIINYNYCFKYPQKILCSPRGNNMKRFFEDLKAVAKAKNIPLPPDPGSYCIGGYFCCCTTYPGSNHEVHLRDFYLILDWSKQFGFTKHIEEFIKNLSEDELLTNPILEYDNEVPPFYIIVNDNDEQYEIVISADEIRKIDPQKNSFPPIKINFNDHPWLKNIWSIQRYDQNLIHLPSNHVLKIN